MNLRIQKNSLRVTKKKLLRKEALHEHGSACHGKYVFDIFGTRREEQSLSSLAQEQRRLVAQSDIFHGNQKLWQKENKRMARKLEHVQNAGYKHEVKETEIRTKAILETGCIICDEYHNMRRRTIHAIDKKKCDKQERWQNNARPKTMFMFVGICNFAVRLTQHWCRV